MQKQPASVLFAGGLDLVTPSITVDPGRLLFANNWEALVEGGYRAIRGYTMEGDGSVPGEGAILGTAVLNEGETLAIRAIVGGASATLWKTVAGVWTQVTINMPVGRYEFDVGNFQAVASGRRLFMQCDNAAAKPWVYDGTSATEISGAQAGAKWLKVHGERLWLGFEVGSLQGSVVGDYTDWAGANGAVEIGVSGTITGLATYAGALIVGCQKSLKVLYGTDDTDFDLKTLIDEFGIKAYSMVELVRPMMVGDHGPMNLTAVQEFGNFSPSDWGRFIEPLFTDEGGNEIFTPVVTLAARKANQFRTFSADGHGVRVTVVGDTMYGATITEFPINIACGYSGLVEGSVEIQLLGSDDGKVYHLDDGNSFDGEMITSTMTTAFASFRGRMVKKRFFRAFLHADPSDMLTVTVLPQFDGGSTDIARHRAAIRDLAAGGALWGAENWGEFVWSGPLSIDEPISVEAHARTVSLTIQITRTTEEPPTLEGYTMVFKPRRISRGK